MTSPAPAWRCWTPTPPRWWRPAPARRTCATCSRGVQPGQAVGRPSKEQAEIARLRRELDQTRQRLDRTETALEIMGKARALLEDISESADLETKRKKR